MRRNTNGDPVFDILTDTTVFLCNRGVNYWGNRIELHNYQVCMRLYFILFYFLQQTTFVPMQRCIGIGILLPKCTYIFIHKCVHCRQYFNRSIPTKLATECTNTSYVRFRHYCIYRCRLLKLHEGQQFSVMP